ncbi:MAG: hypothetical protein AB1782_08760 [Cyanobacteriota bacterium]
MTNDKMLAFKELTNCNHWKNLKRYWKELSSISLEMNFTNKMEMFARLSNNSGSFDSKINNIIENIDKLELVNEEALIFIKNAILDRFNHIQQEHGIVTCYMMGGIAEERKALNELENQYILLDKMFKEEKINSKTYELTKEAIYNSFEEVIKIKSSYSNNQSQLNKSFIDYIVELNK